MNTIKISVRSLVEFIMRSGDITTSASGLKDPDAMQEGAKIHKKLQKRMGAGYQPEVWLSVTEQVSRDETDFEICVEGRADGIYSDDTGIIIDEIKGIYRDVSTLSEPVPIHRAQALCYAYIYAVQHNLDRIGIRMTYCHIPTEELRYFNEQLSLEELNLWFHHLIQEYAKWASWQIRWVTQRNLSIKNCEFPFSYRKGQNDLVKGVYQSILRKKRLYIEAPTGVGKTISTVFPALKAMGEGLSEKIFYLTAKTITRTVAEQTFDLLAANGVELKYVTVTAKEKICILDRPQCNPASCTRALGHYDRVNDAVFDILTNENQITREIIQSYAQKHNVCPFEMCLDTTTWTDAVIGDYNYAFDPTASLKRFFANDTQNDYILLVDEAHNLVDRARKMYSATLVKEDFLLLKKTAMKYSKKLTNALENCNKALLELKRECDSLEKYEMLKIEPFVLKLMRLSTIMDEFLQDRSAGEKPLEQETRDRFLDFYFEIRSFQNIYEILDNKYTVYSDYTEQGMFQLHLQCMDPSTNLDNCLNKVRSAVFFSATLLPIRYYKEQLAGREDDYAIYAPSPFSTSNRLLMIGSDVSTRYTRRGPDEYRKIADYIYRFSSARTGNYLIFFPSYRMLEDVSGYLATEIDRHSNDLSSHIQVIAQNTSMTEEEREAFLSHFQDTPLETTLGLCVMGGIFGEGIDLKDSRLIGAVIVGTGLPMVCTENELFREYFDSQNKSGFNYAYQFPGMNKVLQAAGRVIRTDTDHGAILLLDERFLQPSYQNQFPREWYPYNVVNRKTIDADLQKFWKRVKDN